MADPKKHEPTKETRSLIEALAGFGATQEYMARQLGIGEVQLRRHYKEQLANALEKMNMAVAKTCFAMAVSGKEPSATYFWLKTRAGWRETLRVENNLSGSVDVAVAGTSTEDLEKEAERIRRGTAAADRARTVAPAVQDGTGGVVH